MSAKEEDQFEAKCIGDVKNVLDLDMKVHRNSKTVSGSENVFWK